MPEVEKKSYTIQQNKPEKTKKTQKKTKVEEKKSNNVTTFATWD